MRSGSSVPFVRRLELDRIDMREVVIDFGRQPTITKDTVPIEVDALVYFRVVDAWLAVYSVQNLPDAVELLCQTTLRNIVAHLTLDEMFSSRERINHALLDAVRGDAERWGISIMRVEVLNIIPPADIKGVMEYQIREERERRATVLTADGERESAIIRSKGVAAQSVLRAEGMKTSVLQRAKGEAEGKMIIANAEVESLKLLRAAIEDSNVRATDYLVAMQYLEQLSAITSKEASKVVLVPSKSVDIISKIAGTNM